LSTSNEEPRSKQKKKTTQKKNNHRWAITVFFIAVLLSSTISFLSSTVMEDAELVEAFIVLLFIVFLGILFDIIGVAVMSASEKPFHSMAARKVPGAAEALKLLRNAEKVSNFCNDVIGDICGVVSGSASAVIAVKALTQVKSDMLSQLIMSALVAGVTISGKAFGKTIATSQSTNIVHIVSKIIYYIKSPFCRKKRKKK
jgi:CBS domain containing-hemolysin-like protein